MRCLTCKTNELEELYLEGGLKVYSCRQCNGKWMRFSDYLAWHNNSENRTSDEVDENFFPVEDSTNPKLCPDCGAILTPYKVSSKLGFMLEHCASCNGIWFDNNEWEAIKKIDLHHKINCFFTESWQKKVREDEKKDFMEKQYAKKFGEEDYEKLKQIKKWIDENENKSMLLAYLMNDDPFKL